MESKSKLYERKVYTFQDLLGKLGGISSSVLPIFSIFVSLLNYTSVLTNIITIVSGSLIKEKYDKGLEDSTIEARTN